MPFDETIFNKEMQLNNFETCSFICKKTHRLQKGPNFCHYSPEINPMICIYIPNFGGPRNASISLIQVTPPEGRTAPPVGGS